LPAARVAGSHAGRFHSLARPTPGVIPADVASLPAGSRDRRENAGVNLFPRPLSLRGMPSQGDAVQGATLNPGTLSPMHRFTNDPARQVAGLQPTPQAGEAEAVRRSMSSWRLPGSRAEWPGVGHDAQIRLREGTMKGAQALSMGIRRRTAPGRSRWGCGGCARRGDELPVVHRKGVLRQ